MKRLGRQRLPKPNQQGAVLPVPPKVFPGGEAAGKNGQAELRAVDKRSYAKFKRRLIHCEGTKPLPVYEAIPATVFVKRAGVPL